ncbi:MAG: MATE family efflux transporter [Oscillospiraceae bacterium]
MQQPRENKMGTMPVGKLLLSMSVPVMISMLVQALYNIVDSIFVAKISENALTAVSLTFPLQNLMIAVGVGTAVGTGALLSRSLGEKNQVNVDKAANVGLFLSFASAIVFAILGLLFIRPFFEMQTNVAEIVEGGVIYGKICLGLSVGLFLQCCCERLLQATGRTWLSMATQLLGAVLNIVLDPILIFGLFGAPKLGIAGAAIATVIGQIVAAVAGIAINICLNHEIHLHLREMRFQPAIVAEIYRVGAPSIVVQAIGSVMTFGMNKLLLVFSTTAAAVFGIYFKLQSFVFMPVFGLNSGMVPIISYNYGAGQLHRLKRTVWLAIGTATAIMAVGCTTAQLIPDKLLLLFNASPDMLAIGVPALRIISVSFLLAGFCIIASSVCQAVGNPIHSLIVSVARQLFVLLPVAWLLSLTGRLELVWLAFPIAEVVSLTLSSLFLRSALRRVEKNIKTAE